MSQLTVDSLLEAVQRLPPSDLHQFADRFASWKRNAMTDDQLIQATQTALNAADRHKLEELTAISETGGLTTEDRTIYQELATRAERANVERVQALSELVRRWGQPLPAVMKQIGWNSDRHDA
jgi:hypothetical protein